MTELCAGEEFYFQWHITERCNQRCSHCYHTSYAATGELSLDELDTCFAIMEEALTVWGRKGSFSLTGGEPFVRRDALFHLMGRLDTSDAVAYYDILTNGSLVGAGDLVGLRRAVKLRRVQLSLEAPNERGNDAIRGQGSFRQTLRAIDDLKDADLQVSVMQTITRRNMHSIPEMLDLLSARGVDAFAVERFIPEGAGSGMRESMLSADEARALFEAVHRLALVDRRVRVLMYRPLFALLDREDPTVGAMCSIGVNALTVMHDGTVYPCRRLPVPLGNILKDGLFRIWYESDFLWQVREASRINGCGTCDLVSLCRGCRAMAYHVSGDALGRDPHCWRVAACTA